MGHARNAMENPIYRWVAQFDTRHPYAISVIFVSVGLGCLGYSASVAWNLLMTGPVLEAGSTDQVADAGAVSGVSPDSAAGASPPPVDAGRIRVRFMAHAVVSVCLTILGLMAIGIGYYRYRLVRLELVYDAENLPERLV